MSEKLAAQEQTI